MGRRRETQEAARCQGIKADGTVCGKVAQDGCVLLSCIGLKVPVFFAVKGLKIREVTERLQAGVSVSDTRKPSVRRQELGVQLLEELSIPEGARPHGSAIVLLFCLTRPCCSHALQGRTCCMTSRRMSAGAACATSATLSRAWTRAPSRTQGWLTSPGGAC